MDGLAECRFRLAGATALQQDRAQIAKSPGGGLTGQGLPIGLLCLTQPAQLGQSVGQIGVNSGHVGAMAENLAIGANRLVQPPGAMGRQRQIDEARYLGIAPLGRPVLDHTGDLLRHTGGSLADPPPPGNEQPKPFLGVHASFGIAPIFGTGYGAEEFNPNGRVVSVFDTHCNR